MAARGILCYPHPLLLTPSRPIHDFDDRAKSHMKRLWHDLRDTAASANAAALSAVQIGAQWAAIYISRAVDGQEMFLVNPLITERGALLQDMRETCASLPGIELSMRRSSTLTVSYRKVNGDEGTLVATGQLAQCLAHEINHLDGRTLIECAKPAKRLFLTEQVAKYGGRNGAVLKYGEAR